jgi:hypothetical protein
VFKMETQPRRICAAVRLLGCKICIIRPKDHERNADASDTGSAHEPRLAVVLAARCNSTSDATIAVGFILPLVSRIETITQDTALALLDSKCSITPSLQVTARSEPCELCAVIHLQQFCSNIGSHTKEPE